MTGYGGIGCCELAFSIYCGRLPGHFQDRDGAISSLVHGEVDAGTEPAEVFQECGQFVLTVRPYDKYVITVSEQNSWVEISCSNGWLLELFHEDVGKNKRYGRPH